MGTDKRALVRKGVTFVWPNQKDFSDQERVTAELIKESGPIFIRGSLSVWHHKARADTFPDLDAPGWAYEITVEGNPSLKASGYEPRWRNDLSTLLQIAVDRSIELMDKACHDERLASQLEEIDKAHKKQVTEDRAQAFEQALDRIAFDP